MHIRLATDSDAEQISRVIRASIIDLCQDDHRGDQEVLDQWLANKTPQNVVAWLSNPDNLFFVADKGGKILGAACIRRSGEINLNYVHPSARTQGVSSALLEALEAAVRSRGCRCCTLNSTATARRFYRKHGYKDVGRPQTKFGMTVFPMKKRVCGPSGCDELSLHLPASAASKCRS